MECRLISVDPTVMASSLSEVAGVLAGLVFAGIVVLLGGANHRVQRIRATMLLVSGLFAMVVASVFFAIISGETICLRALGLQAVAVSLLGVGATAIFGGIALLVHAHDDLGYAARLASLGSLLVGIFALFYAVLAPQNFGAEMTASGVVSYRTTWFSPVYTHLQKITAGIVLVTVLVRALAARLRPRQASEGSHALVIVAAYTSVLYIAVAALVGWVLLAYPASDWGPGTSMSGELVRTFCYAIATSAAFAIALQLVALPVSPPRAPAPAGSGTEPVRDQAGR
ncbi:MAG: hypothetical protein IRY85_14020 [Micromonosporaceae bacterium]|nr:hypothetical protein [Micromonosporaceae bacterium]